MAGIARAVGRRPEGGTASGVASDPSTGRPRGPTALGPGEVGVGVSEDGASTPPGVGSVGCCVTRSSGPDGGIRSRWGFPPPTRSHRPRRTPQHASRSVHNRPTRSRQPTSSSRAQLRQLQATPDRIGGAHLGPAVSDQSGRVIVLSRMSDVAVRTSGGVDAVPVTGRRSITSLAGIFRPRTGNEPFGGQPAVLTMKLAAWVTYSQKRASCSGVSS